MPTHKDVHILIPRTREHLTWPKGLCRCDYVRDAEIQRLSWVTQAGPIESHVFIRGKQGAQREKK